MTTPTKSPTTQASQIRHSISGLPSPPDERYKRRSLHKCWVSALVGLPFFPIRAVNTPITDERSKPQSGIPSKR